MTDDEIRERWVRICRMNERGKPLARRIALLECDELEASGVTEADIDRCMTLARIDARSGETPWRLDPAGTKAGIAPNSISMISTPRADKMV